jgi:hypothetical protein
MADPLALYRQMWGALYPDVRRDARNQILADLLVQMCGTEDMYWDLMRWGDLTLDGVVRLTPEQMVALEDALLEHKAKED